MSVVIQRQHTVSSTNNMVSQSYYQTVLKVVNPPPENKLLVRLNS